MPALRFLVVISCHLTSSVTISLGKIICWPLNRGKKPYGVTAEYPATSSPLLKRAGYAVCGRGKELKSRWLGILSSWLRGMRYAERIKFKMARYLKKLATRYAVRRKD